MTQALEHLTTNRGLVTGGSVVHIPVFLPSGDEPDAPMPIPGPVGPAGANGATGATGAPGPPGPALAGEPGEDGAMIFIPTGGGTAVLDINGLTATDVALDDTLPEYDTSATANRKLSVDRLAGFINPSLCDFRLTTQSGQPVSNADRSAQGTLYLTPIAGIAGTTQQGLGRLSLWDGTRWKQYQNAEISLALSSLTSSKNYDVFLFDSSGTLTLELLVWTDDLNRATGLSIRDGVFVRGASETHRYVGTIRTTGTTTTEDSATKRFVWSMDHRVPRKLLVKETTDSWTYTTASWRYVNGSSANRVEVVIGLPEVLVSLESTMTTEVSSAVYRRVGIGKDTNTANSADLTSPTAVGGNVSVPAVAWLKDMPALGYHYYAWVEMGGAGVTFYGDAGAPDQYQSGMVGWLMG